MRVRVRGLAVAVLAAGGLLAGCVPAATGTDGDLLNQWTSLPEPEPFVPEPETCHTSYRSSVRLGMYHPISCDLGHEAETVHVGEFAGEAADRSTPPSEGTKVWRSAYQECEGAAAEYLGGDFRYVDGLWLGVVVPSTDAWGGGARWFRCDLKSPANPDWSEFRRTSLAEVLTDDEFPLRLRCVDTADRADGRVNLRSVDCAESHQAELVGLLEVDHPRYPEEPTQGMFEDCFQLALDYIGIRVTDLRVPTSSILSWPNERDWDNGDRTFLCYLSFADDKVTGSLEGVGAAGLRRALR